MSFLLAPYNDSMRLGMGYNSYTQTMCIDGAVEVTSDSEVNVENPSQVVTYSSKFVERLSDIVSSMNISYSSAIKKGTIEVSGNGNSIDEDKIKASDINLVVSVQVINQTTCLKDSAKFQALEGVQLGTSAFNEAFGDCYISGFIRGGDFSSIISMRSLDRSKTQNIVRSIKKMVKTNEPAEFTMDSYNTADSLSNSSVLKETETTISVSWMGGGQIKDPKTNWDVSSVYEAAASFPSFVAKTPQRTWAILTKYKANRSFSAWATSQSLRPLEYDNITSFTGDLFNNFMEYKQLVKKVQDIINNSSQYTAGLKPKSIPVNLDTLVAVRGVLRNEMEKIVAVVNVLSQKPELLSQSNSFKAVPKNDLLRLILDEAISASPESRVIYDTTKAVESSRTPAATSSADKAQAAPASGTSDAGKIDLSALVAPEVWADLLPTKTSSETVAADAAITPAPTVYTFPAPPADDTKTAPVKVVDTKLRIVSAVCGLQDVTQTMRDRIKDEMTLTIPIIEIEKLCDNPAYAKLRQGAPYWKSLVIIYQYGPDGPMRMCGGNYDPKSAFSISISNKSEDTIVSARPWTKDAWSIIAVSYSGMVFNSEAVLKNVEEQMRKEFLATQTRRVNLPSIPFGLANNPWPYVIKTGMIFFKSLENGPVRVAVTIEGGKFLLTDQPLLSEL